MAELEVSITMAEYKHLKESEARFKKAEGRVKEVEGQLWRLEQQFNNKVEELVLSNVRVKELSLNAMKLAKKVLASQEMLQGQEEKWLKREKDLLQKTIGSNKNFERLEAEIQLGKEIINAKDYTLKETILKCTQCEQKLSKAQKQVEIIKVKHEKAVKEITVWQAKEISMRNEQQTKLSHFKQRLSQDLELSERKIQKLTHNNTELESIIRKMEDQRQKLEVQRQKVQQDNAAERSKFEQLIKHKDESFLELQTKFKLSQQSLWSNLQQISLAVTQISGELKNTSQIVQNEKQFLQLYFKKCKTQLQAIIEQTISEKLVRLALLQQEFDRQNKSKLKEIQRWQELYNLQKEGFEIQMEQFEKKTAKMDEIKEENARLAKIIPQAKRMKNQLQKQLIQTQNKLSELQKTLTQRECDFLKLQQQNKALKQEIRQLKQKQTEKEYEQRQADFKNEGMLEMNTQALQLAHNTIYGRREGLKKQQNYKQAVDELWTPISDYLHTMTHKILEDQALEGLHKEILEEQLKLIFKRFIYLFRREH